MSSTGAFMRILEAVRRMPDPAVIDADLLRWHRDPAEPGNDRPVVLGAEYWVRRCADELATFRELGAPWSAPSEAATRGAG